MFKHIVIAIVIIIPTVQSTNTTILRHLVRSIPVCVKSEICNHTWVPVCGMDKMLLDTRFFTDECDLYDYNCDHKTGYTTVDIEKCSNTSTTEMTAVTPENETTKRLLTTTVTEATLNQTTTTMKIETTIPETTLQETTIIKTTIPDFTTTIPTKHTITETKFPQPTVTQNITTSPISLKVTLTETTLPLTTMSSTTQVPVSTVLSQSEYSRGPKINSTSASVAQSTEPVTTIPLNKVTKLLLTDTTISVKIMTVTAIPIATLAKPTTPENTATTEKKNKIVMMTESSSPINTDNKLTTKTNSTKNNGCCTCSHTHPTKPTTNTTIPTTVTTTPTTIKTTPSTKIAEITTKTESTSEAGGCTCTPFTTASHTTTAVTNITLTDTTTPITTAPNITKPETTISETIAVTHNKMQNSTSKVGACTCTPSTVATFITNMTLPGTPITQETSLPGNKEIVTTPTPTRLKTTKICKSIYPKYCEIPVSWETTVKGERRDFFQILRDRYTKNERRVLRRKFFTPLSGVLISRKNDKSSFWLGSHVESSFDNKIV